MDCVKGKIYINGAYVFVYDKDCLCTSLKSGRVLSECRVVGDTDKNNRVNLATIRKFHLQLGEMVKVGKLRPGRIFSYKKKYYIIDGNEYAVCLHNGVINHDWDSMDDNVKVRTYKKHFAF